MPSAYVYFLDPIYFTPFRLIGKSGDWLQTPLKELAVALRVFLSLWGLWIVRQNARLIPVALLYH